MRRGVYVAVLAIGLLMPAAGASAHKGSAKKAGKYLANVVNAADSTKVSTGNVRVAGCKSRAKKGRHRHSFVCRVTVQLVYPNGTSKTCSDKSVTVQRTKRKYRRVTRTYLNKGGFKCDKAKPLPKPSVVMPKPPVTPPDEGLPPATPPVPGGGTPAPVTTPPTAPPPGLPPLPPFPTKAGTSDRSAHTSNHFAYFNGFYYPWFYDANGYAWLIEQWAYQGPGCRGDYRRFWWWSSSGWTYYYQYWILDSYYSQDQIYGNEPC
jgi:hypothetical protein